MSLYSAKSVAAPKAQGVKFKFGWGFAPGLSNYLGGKIAPDVSIIGGEGDKYLKIPTYLELKGKFFFDPSKTRFLDVLREVPGIFLKVPKNRLLMHF